MSDESEEERQEIDPLFKQIIEEGFAPYKARCQTEYEVSRLPRSIDAFITVEEETERQKIRAETPFFYLLKDSQLEFKGRGDRLTPDGYAKVRGRMEFLLSEKRVAPSSMTTTIISAGKPHAVFQYARHERKRPFVAMKEKGYYRTKEQPSVYLIVINELPIIAKNYPLLLFASNEQKFRETLERMIVEGKNTYIRYAYEVRPQITKEMLTMAGRASRIPRKDLEFIADDIGRELIAVMDPKDVMQAMDPKDVVSGMDAEKQNRLLSLLLTGGSPEDVVSRMDMEKQSRLLSLLLTGGRPEEMFKNASPEQQKELLDFLLKRFASSPVSGTKQTNGSNNH